MKTFKRIILIILAILIILVIVAFLLPRTWHVSRSVYIDANKNFIYAYTGFLSKWNLWTPWTKEADSTAKYELIGPDGEAGTVRKWDGKTIGIGEMRITRVVPGEVLEFDVSFNKGRFQSKGDITIEQSGDSSKVTWHAQGENGYNPVARYFGLIMDHMMGGDLEKALSKLKRVIEERKKWPRIEETTIGEQSVLLVRDSAGPETYSQAFGKGYGEIMAYIHQNKLKPTGKPFAIYLKWDSVTRNAVLDMGFAVDKQTPGKGRVRFEKIPPQKIVMAYYFGDYNNLSPAYNALNKYIREAGKQIAGNPWEIYITDPGTEKDTLKWETDIFFPVK